MAEQESSEIDGRCPWRGCDRQVKRLGIQRLGHARALKYQIQVMGYGLIAVAEAIPDQTRQQQEARR